MFILKKSNFPIGLDISDYSLKIAQLKKVKNKKRFQAIDKLELPKGVIENGEILNKQVLIDSIKSVISKPKFGSVTNNSVVACLPETKTFIKLINIEKNPNDIKSIVSSEIEKYIPLSIKDIYFDWQIVDETNSSYSVLIGACEKNIVDSYTEVLTEAKLSVLALEIESTAVCRALLQEESMKNNKSKKNYAIIDIGKKRTSMIIYSNNSVVLSVSIPLSGNQITDKISKTLEIDSSQAEKAKIVCGLDKKNANGIIGNILSETIKELNKRIDDTLDFYITNYPDKGPIDTIFLTGGGSNIKNIEDTIQEFTKIKTIKGNPFINLDESDDKIRQFFSEIHTIDPKLIKGKDKILTVKQNPSSSYSTAIGLALRNILIKDL